MKSFHFTLITTLFLGACATKQVRDPANDSDVVEMMKQSKLNDENAKATNILFGLKQDLGNLTLKERSDVEELKNFENEIGMLSGVNVEKSLEERQPAAEDSKAKELKQKFPTTFLNKKHSPTQLSKEELTAQLFDADSIVVQKGDSLGSLAEKHLGNKKSWNSIWALNPNLHNPNKLEIGDKLFVPRGIPSRSIASTPAPITVKAPTPVEVAPVVSKVQPKAVAAVSSASSSSAEKNTPSAPFNYKGENLKKVPELKSVVEHKSAKAPSDKATVAEAAPKEKEENQNMPTKEELQIREEAFLPSGTWTASSHSASEQLKEQLDLNYLKHFGSSHPNESQRRKTASTDEAGVAAEQAPPPSTLPKNITSIVSYIGLFLLLAVLGGFFFSKPQKNS